MPAAFLVLFALLVPATTEIEFVTLDLPWAIAEKGYEAPPLDVRVSGSCPHGGVGYAVVSGALPPGMQLSRLGYFSGTPLRTGEFRFTVRASDGCGWAGKQFTLVVTGAPVIKVTSPHISFACKAGETPAEQQVRVSATWPRLAYRLTVSNASWLTATPEHGTTPREGSAMADDIVHLRIDSAGLKPGHYSATIAVTSWQVLQPVVVEVELAVN
jgi:BACON domain-containing protein/putative Ig domain-containing protein